MFRLFLLYALCLFLQPVYATVKHDPFIVVAAPRAGTLLLTRAMEQLTGKTCRNISENELSYEDWKKSLKDALEADAFIQMPAYPTSNQIKSIKSLGYKVIFLVRDPRDQALSLLFFIDQGEWAFGDLSAEEEPYASLSMDDKLHEIITGDRTGFSAMDELFAKYLPWTTQGSQFVLTIRFEDLAGKKAGGSRLQQTKALKSISEFLHLKLSDQQLEGLSRGFDKGIVHGEIGDWRHHFKIDQHHEMQRRYGKMMKKFGYYNHVRENSKVDREAERIKKQKKKESERVVTLPHKAS